MTDLQIEYALTIFIAIAVPLISLIISSLIGDYKEKKKGDKYNE